MEQQPNNGVSEAGAAPILDTNGGASAMNPDVMAAMIMSTQGFMPDGSLAATAITDPSIMAPIMFNNGNPAAGLAMPDRAITAGKTHPLSQCFVTSLIHLTHTSSLSR